MGNQPGQRRFGSQRKRGARWRARHLGLTGELGRRPAHSTADNPQEQWLTLMEGRTPRGVWQHVEADKVDSGTCAGAWITDRRLEPGSRELYEVLLRLHLPGTR